MPGTVEYKDEMMRRFHDGGINAALPMAVELAPFYIDSNTTSITALEVQIYQGSPGLPSYFEMDEKFQAGNLSWRGGLSKFRKRLSKVKPILQQLQLAA